MKAKFPAMYNAFCYGAPPHAGIAPGRRPHGHAAGGRGFDPRGHPVPDEQERAGHPDGRAQRGRRRSSSTSCTSPSPRTKSNRNKEAPVRWTGVPFMIGQAMHTKAPSTKEGAGRAKRGLGEFSFFSPDCLRQSVPLYEEGGFPLRRGFGRTRVVRPYKVYRGVSESADSRNQGIHFFLSGGPAGAEARDAQSVRRAALLLECELAPKKLPPVRPSGRRTADLSGCPHGRGCSVRQTPP